jgi:hypothetical protein
VPNSNKPCPLPVVATFVCVLMLGGCAAQPLKFDEASGTYYPADSADSVAPKRVAKGKPKAPAAKRAVLETPAEPDCGAQKSPGRAETAKAEPSMTEGAGDANADLALRIKLEYERECYRQAEARMRDRVKQLQTSGKAGKGSEASDAATVKR